MLFWGKCIRVWSKTCVCSNYFMSIHVYMCSDMAPNACGISGLDHQRIMVRSMCLFLLNVCFICILFLPCCLGAWRRGFFFGTKNSEAKWSVCLQIVAWIPCEWWSYLCRIATRLANASVIGFKSTLKDAFGRVDEVRPRATRKESSEMYLYADGFNSQPDVVAGWYILVRRSNHFAFYMQLFLYLQIQIRVECYSQCFLWLRLLCACLQDKR